MSSPSSPPKTVGWRIVKARHAEGAFTGEGARLFGGRWNPVGVPVVYLSEHQSLGALEVVVHMHPITPRDRFAMIRAEWSPEIMETVADRRLPAHWRNDPPASASQNFGARWVEERRSAVLSVPSTLVPGERNFVLNPAHPDFATVTVGRPDEFSFDGRLLNR